VSLVMGTEYKMPGSMMPTMSMSEEEKKRKKKSKVAKVRSLEYIFPERIGAVPAGAVHDWLIVHKSSSKGASIMSVNIESLEKAHGILGTLLTVAKSGAQMTVEGAEAAGAKISEIFSLLSNGQGTPLVKPATKEDFAALRKSISQAIIDTNDIATTGALEQSILSLDKLEQGIFQALPPVVVAPNPAAGVASVVTPAVPSLTAQIVVPSVVPPAPPVVTAPVVLPTPPPAPPVVPTPAGDALSVTKADMQAMFAQFGASLGAALKDGIASGMATVAKAAPGAGFMPAPAPSATLAPGPAVLPVTLAQLEVNVEDHPSWDQDLLAQK